MMKRQPFPPTKLMYSVFLAILVLLLAAPFTMAQGIPTKPNSDVPLVTNQQGPTDPWELEAFIDGVMAAQMEAYHIPGATISVVKDGKLFFAKGYGSAELTLTVKSVVSGPTDEFLDKVYLNDKEIGIGIRKIKDK